MRVLVPLADGAEEMEATIVIDTLRRAQWDVVSAGLHEGVVTCSRGVQLIPDRVWGEIDAAEFEMIVIPGGNGGVQHLEQDERILAVLRAFSASNRWIAAVCAGPLVLQAAGILAGRRVTCHPAAADELVETERVEESVVVDDRLVTSQGPGTSFEFALTLISLVDGTDKAESIASGMVLA